MYFCQLLHLAQVAHSHLHKLDQRNSSCFCCHVPASGDWLAVPGVMLGSCVREAVCVNRREECGVG